MTKLHPLQNRSFRCKRDALPAELNALNGLGADWTAFLPPKTAKIEADWFTGNHPNLSGDDPRQGWHRGEGLTATQWSCVLAEIPPILLAHFWSKVDVRPTGCWPWRGLLTEFGYGAFASGHKIVGSKFAHRFAYHVTNGPIPPGLMVRHLCGNKVCVNPDHLAVGTMKDNAADGLLLGERLYGARNGKTKLTEEQALYVFRNPDGLRNRDLARKFGVSPATITLIQKGERRQVVTQTDMGEAA